MAVTSTPAGRLPMVWRWRKPARTSSTSAASRSRPAAVPVAEADELARVIPVIQGLRRQCTLPISIDSYKAAVARAALDAGADIVNDISALRFDPAMVSLVASGKGAGDFDAHAGHAANHAEPSRTMTMSCAR